MAMVVAAVVEWAAWAVWTCKKLVLGRRDFVALACRTISTVRARASRHETLGASFSYLICRFLKTTPPKCGVVFLFPYNPKCFIISD